ncbi:MAG TPA: hypothetical protein VG502_13850 [Flexivirga sp.]|uniref:hypothetical protein n=1 Tax=Flexivirga sp. TaxID=1962927 RepID=UPI002CF68627|nr:hypothetical protein [Flexivirga sp.]HWC23378.1 hypothetical protein [Flexivirga sp.]
MFDLLPTGQILGALGRGVVVLAVILHGEPVCRIGEIEAVDHPSRAVGDRVLHDRVGQAGEFHEQSSSGFVWRLGTAHGQRRGTACFADVSPVRRGGEGAQFLDRRRRPLRHRIAEDHQVHQRPPHGEVDERLPEGCHREPVPEDRLHLVAVTMDDQARHADPSIVPNPDVQSVRRREDSAIQFPAAVMAEERTGPGQRQGCAA